MDIKFNIGDIKSLKLNKNSYLWYENEKIHKEDGPAVFYTTHNKVSWVMNNSFFLTDTIEDGDVAYICRMYPRYPYDEEGERFEYIFSSRDKYLSFIREDFYSEDPIFSRFEIVASRLSDLDTDPNPKEESEFLREMGY